PDSDIAGHENIQRKTFRIILPHNAIAQHGSPLNSLFNGVERKDVIRIGNERLVHKMTKIRKPDFVTEVPHTRTNRIIKLLFDGNAISAFELFSSSDIQITLEEWIADSDEFEFMT